MLKTQIQSLSTAILSDIESKRFGNSSKIFAVMSRAITTIFPLEPKGIDRKETTGLEYEKMRLMLCFLWSKQQTDKNLRLKEDIDRYGARTFSLPVLRRG